MAKDTICSKFLEISQRDPESIAVTYPQKMSASLSNQKAGNKNQTTKWFDITWQSYRTSISELAAGLEALGIKSGDKIAVFSNTRVEWAYIDMSILSLGAVTVPIYHNHTNEDVAYIINNSEAKFVFCENFQTYRKLKDILSQTPHIEKIICMDTNKIAEDSRCIYINTVMTEGSKIIKNKPLFFNEKVKKVSPEEMATIIYTSGTTGQPKGVVLTHAQIMSEISDTFPLLGVSWKDKTLSFLPYAHVLGRIELWGHYAIGFTLCFAESIERLKENLIQTKPTILVAVPRVFEKIYAGIQAQIEISPVKQKVFDWAIKIGRQVSQCKIERKALSLDVALQYQLARKTLFDQIKERMGGNLRFVISGGAPLNREIAEFFHAIGLTLLEGYGLTETTAAITVNTPFDYRFGTVGKPIGDVKIRLAEDGEILVQSKKVMLEYYKDPQSTKEALKDHWFYTGDIGEWTEDGFLKITDRKKDLIKTAGGKFVAPQKLESLLELNKFISHAHIHGDQKKYVVALITLNPQSIREYAEKEDISYKDLSALAKNPKIRRLIHESVSEVNSKLASFESIKNFEILPRDFSLDEGELTPSLKVKRKFIDSKYKETIEKLY